MTTMQDQAPAGYVTVVAHAKGFYGKGKLGSRIQENETFFVPEGTRCGSWFGPVNPDDAKKLLPSRKPEKQKAQAARIRAERIAADPATLVQTMREFAVQHAAPDRIPDSKVMDLPRREDPKPPKMFNEKG